MMNVSIEFKCPYHKHVRKKMDSPPKNFGYLCDKEERTGNQLLE